MGTPYLCELRLMSFNFAPKGWAAANGQLLAINQNQAIFALLGTMYGGNGQTNFGLPNLQSRVALHMGNNFVMGQQGGETAHTVTIPEMPSHTHIPHATGATQNSSSPINNFCAMSAGSIPVYGTANVTQILPSSVSSVGGNQPHENEQPYLVMTWCIALQGIFPSQN